MKKLIGFLIILLSFSSCICLKKQHRPRYYKGEYQVVLHMDTTWIYDGPRLLRRFVDTADSQYREAFTQDNLD